MSNDLATAATKAGRRLILESQKYNALIGGRHGGNGPSSKQTRPSIRPVKTVVVKDNIVTIDSKTTCASGVLKDYQSPFEATVVERLRNAKYQIQAKTNMDEFGMGSHSTHSLFGPVHNRKPWENRSAGGSSGGSAVTVATGEYEYALGTDTGGSVRLPAAYNGVVGLKPSYGRVSRFGVVSYANSLDTVGMITRSCARINPKERNPLAHCLYLMSHHDPRDPTSLTKEFRARIKARNNAFSRKSGRWGWDEMKRLRIGVPIEYNIEELQPAVRAAWEIVLEKLKLKGHTIVPVSLPSTNHALSAYYVLAAAEAASNLAKYDGIRYGTRTTSSDGAGTVLYDVTRGDGFGEEVKRRILLGSYTLSSEAIDNHFIQAQKVRRLVQRDFDRVFAMPNSLHDPEQFDLSDLDENISLQDKLGPAQVDVLVCPTAPSLPPLLKDLEEQSPIDSYMNDVFTVPASLAGLPAISVPVKIPQEHRVPDNVDFTGIQVIGQFFDDYHVLNVGSMIEALPGVRHTQRVKTKKQAIRREIAGEKLRHFPRIRYIYTMDGKSSVKQNHAQSVPRAS